MIMLASFIDEQTILPLPEIAEAMLIGLANMSASILRYL